MNLKSIGYWLNHKAIRKIVAVATIVLLLMGAWLQSSIEEIERSSSKRAANSLSTSELDAARKYNDLYKQNLPIHHVFLKQISFYLAIALLGNIIYCALITLNILERHQKE